MTRNEKIRRIKSLIDGANNIKDFAIAGMFFYTNGVDYFKDRSQTIKVTKDFIDKYYKAEAIRQRAKNIIPIIINNGDVSRNA
tara:strand:- start:630 stop:878 length:249 start_codon:yes stop_codon:yes gene_type:complete